jgi:membrane-associated phospholipid phosphatase
MHVHQIENMGNHLQYITAIAGLAIAVEHRQVPEYLLITGQTLALVGAGKQLGTHCKFKASQRPIDRKNYRGIPSGHTAITWNAAAFAHKKGGLEYSWPLYAMATFTGYSRIKAHKHTIGQVILGAALAELVNYGNKNLQIYANPDGVGIRVIF